MINPQWLELPMSRTNFHGPKDVRVIEVRLYFAFKRIQCESLHLLLHSYSLSSLAFHCFYDEGKIILFSTVLAFCILLGESTFLIISYLSVSDLCKLNLVEAQIFQGGCMS